MQAPELSSDARFKSFELRQRNQAALDPIIGEWSKRSESLETERKLQAAGVPAHAVQTPDDMWKDPQLQHRDHYVKVPHERMGQTYVENSRFKLMGTPARVERSGPILGGGNDFVLREILGYDEDRISELVVDGALG
jgi:crotonobetainyl-CoA:carnitine CoA-transferase CaiB-like acyl-CoA transferase